MKKISKILALAMVVFMLVGLMPGNVFAEDNREKISTITATSSPKLDSIIGFGKNVTKPKFTVTEGSPAYFYDTTASWRKMNGGNWEDYTETVFTEGIYKYNIQVRVDDAAGKTHVIDENGVNVTVDGNAWNCVRPETFDDYSYVWATSKAFEVKGSSTPATVTSIKVNSTDHKTEYKVDEPLDVTDLTIEATMSDGTKPTITVTSDMVTDFNTSTAGTKTVTINYQGQTTTFNINVTVKEEHDVNINPAIEHGKVTATPTKAKMGEEVTLNITPDAGYVVDEIRVMDDGASNVPVKDNKFTMPDMLVNVTVTFKPTPPTPADHSITINPTTNGTVKADKEKAKKGDTVTLTINPTAGYELKEIKVMAGTDIITVTGNKFTMPDKDVTVTVTFKEKTGTPPTPPTPPTPTPTPTPTPDPYYPGYDDWYEPYRPHRPYRPSKPVEEKKSEEKPIDKPAKKVETEVILTIGSNNLDNKINGIDSFKGMDVAPYIKNGRTMLPIRYVAEALGMSVSWDAKTRTVIISDMFYTVEIPVDTNKIIVNGDVFTSDVKPEIVHGRTMMPIANIARALGLKDGKDIIWDASMRQVIIKRIYDKKEN